MEGGLIGRNGESAVSHAAEVQRPGQEAARTLCQLMVASIALEKTLNAKSVTQEFVQVWLQL